MLPRQKKLSACCLAVVLMLFCVPCSSGHGETYEIEDARMTLQIPDDMHVFTPETSPWSDEWVLFGE